MNYKVKDLKKEGWISFNTKNDEKMLSQEVVDRLVKDTNKWAQKFNSEKIKNNKSFQKRLYDLREREEKIEESY